MSLTYQGVVLSAVAFVLKLAGVPFVQGDVENAISVILAVAGAVITLYGRWRAGGLTIWGTRVK